MAKITFIQHNGNEQTVDVRSKDELGETADAFRSMLDYLRTLSAAAARIGDPQIAVRLSQDALGPLQVVADPGQRIRVNPKMREGI